MSTCRIAFMMVLVPGAALAQPSPQTADTQPKPKPLPFVFVQPDKGAEIKGTLLKLDDKEVIVLVKGLERRLDLTGVRRVQEARRSAWRGALAGALMGVGLAFSWDFFAFVSGNWDYVWGRKFFLGSMAAGAVGGVLIARHSDEFDRRTLYKRPKQPKSTTIALRLRWN